MSLKGIIDLGSNSMRLVVYEVKPSDRIDEVRREAKKGNGPIFYDKLFRDILDKKKVAGLSAYVKDGVFSREGIERAIEVLQEHIRSAKNIGCDKVHIFATAVIRNCSNSEEVARRISKAVDVDIDVLSAEDEAHLGFVGATCDRNIQTGTLIDIGGGSTELTSINDNHDSLNISIPQGSVSSYANYVRMILPAYEEAENIEAAFREKLANVDIDAYKTTAMFGIGGSVRATGKLYAAAFSNDQRPRTLEQYQLKALCNLLQEHPSTFAHTAAKSAPDRLHTIVPGMVIVNSLMDILGAKSLTICKYGVREGYLIERVLKANR